MSEASPRPIGDTRPHRLSPLRVRKAKERPSERLGLAPQTKALQALEGCRRRVLARTGAAKGPIPLAEPQSGPRARCGSLISCPGASSCHCQVGLRVVVSFSVPISTDCCRNIMFRELLEQIAGRCDGLLGLSLVGKDGLPIETLSLSDEVDLEMLSAELVAVAQAARDNHGEFGGGPLRSVCVETDQIVMLLGEAAEDVFLLLLLDRRRATGCAVARARYELRRSPLELRPALEGSP